MTPKEKAQQRFDRQLQRCGSVVQDFAGINIPAGPGGTGPQEPGR